MRLPKVILAGALVLIVAGCTAPEPTPRYYQDFEGYAVKEEVEPASFEHGFTPDTLLPGETRIEVIEVPDPPADVDPPANLDEEPVPDAQFPYSGLDDGGVRGRPRPRPR